MTTDNTPWELGVPQTIDGVEYVVVQLVPDALAVGAMQRQFPAPHANGLYTCRGCPCSGCAGPGRMTSNTPPCGSYGSGAPRLRIVPLKLVPILALEGVLE